jgi:hypothetical protein
MARTLRLLILPLLLALVPLQTDAQVMTGTLPFGSFSGGPDTINNANLNAQAGRGQGF